MSDTGGPQYPEVVCAGICVSEVAPALGGCPEKPQRMGMNVVVMCVCVFFPAGESYYIVHAPQ